MLKIRWPPVLILYWTAEDADGRVSFRKDVYGRDERVLEALDGEFRLVVHDV